MAMYRGREKSEWNLASAILAMLANIHSKERYKPNDFNPYVKRVLPLVTQDIIDEMTR